MKPVKGSSVRSCHATLLKTPAEEKTCSGMNFLLERETHRERFFRAPRDKVWMICFTFSLFSHRKKKSIWKMKSILMNSNQRNDPLCCVYVWGTKWGRKVGWGIYIHLSALWVLLRVQAGSISHVWERLFSNTSAHFHPSHHGEKTFTVSGFGPSFCFFEGGGIHAGIFSFTLNHCHQRIPYAGKSKCQTDGFMSGYTLPRCKSSFFRKCEIKWSYYIKSYNTLHISSWWLETPEQQTKTAVSLQSARVIL